MALYLKNKNKIETIFEKGFIIKVDDLLFKGYDFEDDEMKYGVSVSKKLFPLVLGGEHSLTPGAIRPFVKNVIMQSLFHEEHQ